MTKVSFKKYILDFKRAAGTSRGVLRQKKTYFIEIQKDGGKGVGEANLFEGLSFDDVPNYEQKLQWVSENIEKGKDFLMEHLKEFPSIQFGLEQAFLNLNHGKQLYFPSAFTKGEASIRINGLIWMGTSEFMIQQIKEKLSLGFDCIKLKIGTHWQQEHQILKDIRKEFPKEKLELRVDANGAFTYVEAMQVLKDLSALGIHSIEQPLKPQNWYETAKLCQFDLLPIALDEQLIGVIEKEDKAKVLDDIKPHYIILKPALIGGFSGAEEWIKLAQERNIGWWITSALESNVGLNAIAQWTATLESEMPQGLGTGSLFTNNLECPLELKGQYLKFKPYVD